MGVNRRGVLTPDPVIAATRLLQPKRRQLGDEAGPLASVRRVVAILVEMEDGAGNRPLDILRDRGAVVVAGASIDEQAGLVDLWQNRAKISCGEAAPAGDQGGRVEAAQPLA